MLAQDRVEETSFSFSEHVPTPPDRRNLERHIKILRVGAIFVDGRRELCLIRNISAGGLMAHVYSSVRVGQRVGVELKSNQQATGRVVWVREANAGIAFDESVDIGDMLANPAVLDNGWRARAPRVEVNRPAVLRVGARTYRVRTRDISQSGIKIDTDHELEPNGEVMLTPEDFRAIAGTVRWQQGRACGISFHQLVPLAELIAWLKRS
jgi:PilZ domain